MIDNSTINEYEQKIEQNKKPIISKNFLELTQSEKEEFVVNAKTKYIYYNKDGVNVAYGKERENTNGKFDIELFACKKLVEYGHEVYLLPEDYAKDENGEKKIHGDTVTDDRILELKHTDHNIKDNFKQAKKQATDIFIHILDEMTPNEALGKINGYLKVVKESGKQKFDIAGKIYLYFEKTKIFKLYEYKSDGTFTEEAPEKLGEVSLN